MKTLFANLYVAVVFLGITSTAFGQFSLQAGYSGQAQFGSNQWGTGQWGGQQGCSYPTMTEQTALSGNRGQTSQTENQSAEKTKISNLEKDLKLKELEKTRADKELEIAMTKLARYFDSEILDFILGTHIDKMNKCSDYKTFPDYNCEEKKVTVTAQSATEQGESFSSVTVAGDCGSKDDVPAKLKSNWSRGKNYCTANSESNRGLVAGTICEDVSLRPSDGMKGRATSECSKLLTDYRKNKILRDNVQSKIEKIQDDKERAELMMADADERKSIEKKNRSADKTEAVCEECEKEGRGYAFQGGSSGRDWMSSIVQIGLGLGLGYMGKKYDESAMEYQAQLGYPPKQGYPTAISMGLPFLMSGVYGAVSGGNTQNSFGCGGSIGGNQALGYPQQMMYGGLSNAGGGANLGNTFGNSLGGAYGGLSPNLYGTGSGYGFGNNYGGNTYGNLYGNGFNASLYGATGSQYSNMYGTGYGVNSAASSYALQYQAQLAQQQQYQLQLAAYQQPYQAQTQPQLQSAQIQQEILALQYRLQMLNLGGSYTTTYGVNSSGIYSNGTAAYYGTGILGTTNTVLTNGR